MTDHTDGRNRAGRTDGADATDGRDRTASTDQHGSTGPGTAAGPGQRLGIFDKDLLERCISCGFCLPACPTYALTGQETSSPRGRITLMRALETGTLAEDDPTLLEESSFCLGCRACETVCPAGVEYGSLLEQWRDHQWRGRNRPWIARALMALVSHPALLGLQGIVRRHARGRTPASAPSPGAPRTGADRQGPSRSQEQPERVQAPEQPAPDQASGQPVSLMLGCVERGLYPKVSRAVLQLRPEITVPPRQGCCGALHAHNGDSAAGEAMARELGEKLPGTIVTTAGGCAAHLAHHLGRGRVRELSEYLDQAGHRPAGQVMVDGRRARVALQDSCHLRNALGVTRPPRDLVAAVADYLELPGAGDCCGAAGTYAMLRPDDSRAVLDPKLDAVETTDVDYVVAVNPGCLRQLQQGLRRRGSRAKAVHLAELLAMAAESEPAGATAESPGR